MQKQRVLVSVVGFSDVERHALNTVFRLSQSRDLSYAPYVPLTAPGVAAPKGVSEVALVDGESAEAVLSHAKEMPTGQRLIWVGKDAPEHAWRVMDRPIDWAAVRRDFPLLQRQVHGRRARVPERQRQRADFYQSLYREGARAAHCRASQRCCCRYSITCRRRSNASSSAW